MCLVSAAVILSDRWVITETNGRELEAMPEQVTVPPAPKVLRDRPQFEG